MKVAVLLATFNGEKFIKEQLDSIINQSYKDFTLYISDDGSTDGTVEMIKEYQKKYPSIITVLDEHKPTGSACKNFLYLLEQVASDVYLFCDQDDVWLENHIAVFIEKYQKIYSGKKNIPILIHSDTVIVDEKLNVLCNSGFKYMGVPLNPEKHSYYVMNNVSGCASMINESLKQMVFYNKKELTLHQKDLLMHDHFFACIASIMGEKYVIPEPTLLYRQHTGNVCGAGKRSICQKIKQFRCSMTRSKVVLNQYQIFASFFLSYFSSFLNDRERKALYNFSVLNDVSKMMRIILLIRENILRNGFVRNLWLFFLI